MGGLIVVAAGFLLLWLFVIVPQRRQARAAQLMQDAVDVGDEIVTAGGLYGRVTAIDEEGELDVEIAPGVVVRVARRAIVGLETDDAQDDEEPDEPRSDPEPGS